MFYNDGMSSCRDDVDINITNQNVNANMNDNMNYNEGMGEVMLCQCRLWEI